MQKQQLESLMKLHGDTIATLAEKIGIGSTSLSLKKSGKRAFTQDEISKIAKVYNLTSKQITAIFFAE